LSDYCYEELRVSSVEEIAEKIRELAQVEDGDRRVPLMRGEKEATYVPTACIFRSDFQASMEHSLFMEFLRNVPAHSNIDITDPLGASLPWPNITGCPLACLIGL